VRSFAFVGSVVAAALLLIPTTVSPVRADEPADNQEIRQELEALKQGQQEIRRLLQQIQRQLQARQAPSRPAGPSVEGKTFDLGSNAVKGDAGAGLTLVEFSDYQCPYCGRHARQTLPQIVQKYLDSGELRYAFLDFPLERIHPLAFKGAEAAHCAGEQGKYWEMHDRLFAHQKELTPWTSHAEAIGLDVASFEQCLDSDRYADQVRSNMAEGQKAGVSGTPSFVLARTDPDDPTKVEGITFIRGAQPFSAFQQAIEAAQTGDEEE
jgi:protein-disulfide isomerase